MSAAKAAATTFVDPNEAASPLDADASWGAIIVYDNAPAGKHAMHTLEGIRRQLGGGIEIYPSLWRFDLLEDPDWRAAATAEAVQAGLVIISTSSKGELPAPVRDWIHACLQARTSAPGALVALLGPADDPDGADSPRIQFLKSAAAATGLDFFAPTPHAATPPPAAAASPAPARFAHRILLVEDESAILEFNTLVLMGGGYQVTAVEGCEAAWAAIQSDSYDLLVTDNQMPGMSGLELVSKLRSAQIGLPIIVASGGVEAETFAQNQSLQPAIALPKPFTAGQLLETVAETLRRAGRDPPQTEGSLSASGDAYSHWGLNE
jgi:CheY-like chemotaxis protein